MPVWIEPGAEGNMKDHTVVGHLKSRVSADGRTERGSSSKGKEPITKHGCDVCMCFCKFCMCVQ